MIVLRTVRRRDLRELQGFATTAVVYVDDADERDLALGVEDGVAAGSGARFAEGESGIVGYARTLLRSGAAGVEAELTSVLIARRAR
jgi:hypothetical protein